MPNKTPHQEGVQLEAFLTSSLDGGAWSASLPDQSILAEKNSFPVNRLTELCRIPSSASVLH
jgi:hypothetical protein